jgi:methyl-accepting chemotaxis protein
MNSEEAIQAHRAWKERFFVAMAKRQPLNVQAILADDCCDFGKWLYGQAKDKYGHLSSYRECVALHAAFHQEAGKIAQEINDGEFLNASHQFLNHDTAYAKASAALIMGTIAVFKELQTEESP